VILEEIIPEHSEFDIANNDKGYSSFRDVILSLSLPGFTIWNCD
jgi:hypothetical protein